MTGVGGKAAIIGIGQTEFSKHAGRSETQLAAEAIRAGCGVAPELSCSGGTSDGRFIARICPQVIEFGPTNATIHKIDENVELASLEPLKNIYRRTIEALLRT